GRWLRVALVLALVCLALGAALAGPRRPASARKRERGAHAARENERRGARPGWPEEAGEGDDDALKHELLYRYESSLPLGFIPRGAEAAARRRAAAFRAPALAAAARTDGQGPHPLPSTGWTEPAPHPAITSY